MDNNKGAVHSCSVNLFKQAGADLFATYGLQFQHEMAREPDALVQECFMSVLGASAEGVKILCYIRFTAKVGESLYAGEPSSRGAEQLRDLCGELNNQLVGKVKNKLLAYQCRLLLGLPTHLSGRDLAATSNANASVASLNYGSVAGNVDVVVHTIIHEEFVMEDQPDESLVGVIEEGTLAFF
jgi:CheY-specific phosphatase CheX